MSGEITLSGKILKVAGLREKLILAQQSKINKVYLPKDNESDLINLKEIYDGKISIVLVDNYMEIFQDIFKK